MKSRSAKPLSPFQWIARSVITAFFCLHVSAIVWWLVPANGYPKDNRTAEMPAWFAAVEQTEFNWKRNSFGTPWARLLEDYIFATAGWQSWWLFAPNPMKVHDWITVKAVIAWKDPDPATPEFMRKKGPWGNEREPIYDEKPLYTSYEGALPERMKGQAGWYRHDPKLVENLASGNWDRPLASFADFWGKVYQRDHGHAPAGVHVLVTRGQIPDPFSGRTPASDQPTERVLWYVHY